MRMTADAEQRSDSRSFFWSLLPQWSLLALWKMDIIQNWANTQDSGCHDDPVLRAEHWKMLKNVSDDQTANSCWTSFNCCTEWARSKNNYRELIHTYCICHMYIHIYTCTQCTQCTQCGNISVVYIMYGKSVYIYLRTRLIILNMIYTVHVWITHLQCNWWTLHAFMYYYFFASDKVWKAGGGFT